MGVNDSLSAGDSWPHHYRGFRLRVSPDETIWWQLYDGTDRLELEPGDGDIAENLLGLKRQGGRIHVTEHGDVLTRVEESDEYEGVYVGTMDLDGELHPEGEPEYSVPVRPAGLTAGDLWPSVYDGARYSFVDDRVWWNNGATNRRHRVDNGLPSDVLGTLQRYKSQGGSFRITPWGDVITLIPSHPAPDLVQEQFGDLPRVVQNIIKLRKQRGVEMLPVYVGNVGDWAAELSEPNSLSDALSDEEEAELASWASGLGTTTSTSTSNHTAQRSTDATDDAGDGTGVRTGDGDESDREVERGSGRKESGPTSADGPDDPTDQGGDPADGGDDDRPSFDDDPMDWIRRDIDSEEE